MSENSKKWYVLRTAGGKEKKAKEGPGLFTRLKTTLNDMFKEDDNEA